jgi:Holliday junction resolvase-like predicted endonuclease
LDELEKSIRQAAMQVVEAQGNANAPSAVDILTQKLELKLDPAQPPEEQVKAIIDVKATAQAIEDEDLTRGVTDRKKAEILNHADAHLKQEEAQNRNADIKLQAANYGVYEGVATYAGIKKPLPQKMQSILFTILSVVQTILLIAFGIPISIINIIADGVDSIVKKLGNITRSARWIVLIALAAGVVWLIIVVAKYFLAKSGIIS